MIETERLILRGWSDTDFEPYAAFWADEELARYVGGACSRDDAWRRMATVVGHWTLRGYGTWALEDKATGAYLGWCGLWYPEGWPEPEIGWGLVRAAQGRGFATEAARRSRAFAYETLGWSTAISVIGVKNHPSQRVAERLDARCETTCLVRGMEAGIYRHLAPGAITLT